MINLLNKILSRFHLKLISTKPVDLVEESVKYLNRLGDLRNDSLLSPYVGDIVYLQERVKGEFPQVSGKTYFQYQVLGKDKTFFNFDGEKYTTEELEAKLK
jgi:hypothetical protein